VRIQASRDAQGLSLRARRDAVRPFAGAYRSALRGQGLIFEELRDYSPGDDAQWIEWNATARLGRPILKQMREERERAVVLLLDLSDSSLPGYAGHSRRSALLRAAAALAFAATQAGDPLGALCFGCSDSSASGLSGSDASSFDSSSSDSSGPDSVGSDSGRRGRRGGRDSGLRSWPIRTGQAHFARVLDGIESVHGGGGSDLGAPLAWVERRAPRGALVILLTDGYCTWSRSAVARCARRTELILLRLDDAIDRMSPQGAPARVRGAEGGYTGLWRSDRCVARLELDPLNACGAEAVALEVSEVISELRRFFARRVGRAD